MVGKRSRGRGRSRFGYRARLRQYRRHRRSPGRGIGICDVRRIDSVCRPRLRLRPPRRLRSRPRGDSASHLGAADHLVAAEPVQQGEGVLHVTDDVLLLAQAALGPVGPCPELFPASQVRGFVLRDACEHLEFYPRTSKDIETYDYMGGMKSFPETFDSRIARWIEQNPSDARLRQPTLRIEQAKSSGLAERSSARCRRVRSLALARGRVPSAPERPPR